MRRDRGSSRHGLREGGTARRRAPSAWRPRALAHAVRLALLLGSPVLLGVLPPQPAAALGLGTVAVDSHLGQPFSATIPLQLEESEVVEHTCIGIGAGDDLPGLPRPRVEVQARNGKTLLLVRTRRPVYEPAVQMVVDVRCPGFPPSRRTYTVLLDPPESVWARPPQPVAAAPAAKARSSAPAAEPARRVVGAPSPPRTATPVAPSAPREGRAVPVRRGDTLSAIVARAYPGQDPRERQRLMRQIVASNPTAFPGGRPDRLLAGAVLVIPDGDRAERRVAAAPAAPGGAAQPEAPGLRILSAEEEAAARPATTAGPALAGAQTAAAVPEQAGDSGVAAPSGREAPAPARRLPAELSEQSRLINDLTERLAAAQARIGELTEAMARLDARLATLRTPPAPGPAETTAAPPAGPELEPAAPRPIASVAVIAEPAPAPGASPATPPTHSPPSPATSGLLGEGWYFLGLAAALVGALVVLLLRLGRRGLAPAPAGASLGGERLGEAPAAAARTAPGRAAQARTAPAEGAPASPAGPPAPPAPAASGPRAERQLRLVEPAPGVTQKAPEPASTPPAPQPPAAEPDVTAVHRLMLEAELHLLFDQVGEARAVLEQAVEADNERRPDLRPWKMLFDLLRQVGDQATFDRYTARFQRRYNVTPPSWEGPPPTSEGGLAERFPHVMDRIAQTWGTTACLELLNSLLLDDRGGSRRGFDYEIGEEISFLRDVLDRRGAGNGRSVTALLDEQRWSTETSRL